MKLSTLIIRLIDLCRVGLLRKVPPTTFRYAVCGGANLALNWVLYFLVYNFVICKRFLNLGFVVVSPHILTMIIVFPVTFFTGFWLQRNITFLSSPLRGGTQLGRYALSVGGSLLLNYLGLKLCVEALHIYPTPSQMLVSTVTVTYSYLMQSYFTFRGHGSK